MQVRSISENIKTHLLLKRCITFKLYETSLCTFNPTAGQVKGEHPWKSQTIHSFSVESATETLLGTDNG